MSGQQKMNRSNSKMIRSQQKTACAMTNVSILSVSLRRKTNDLPHSVAQTYWIKKDVSPLFQRWLLGGPTETTKVMVRAFGKLI